MQSAIEHLVSQTNESKMDDLYFADSDEHRPEMVTIGSNLVFKFVTPLEVCIEFKVLNMLRELSVGHLFDQINLFAKPFYDRMDAIASISVDSAENTTVVFSHRQTELMPKVQAGAQSF